MTDTVDQQIIRRLQGEFPLVSAPYRVLADEIGIAEAELLARLQRMKTAGILRKMGAVLQHRVAGFHGNALCCWQVPAAAVAGVVAQLVGRPAISHVYLRQPQEQWPYNLYTVFHAHTREECLAQIERTAQELNLTDYRVLFSRKNWKRSQLVLLRESSEE
ncbi:MAG: Lrp/AsnC family transcriptional regulator [Veillonellaceae bacterium]|nr:Lrp/AsnC family transcriptional regulator [Veillonellaceae bacterium]